MGALAVAGGPHFARAQVVTTSFQNGANGYAGTFDRVISDRGGEFERDGNTVADFFLDGFSAGTTVSPDEQGLLRFDNVFGNGPGQVPAGATILSAEVTVVTSLRGNAQTAGPYGVSGLLAPIDSSTTYFNYTSTTELGSRGPWWMDGSATRPAGSFGNQQQGTVATTSVTPIVQSWADGAPAYGFAVQAGMPDTLATTAGTADGWAYLTTGYPFADQRPKLSIEYTTAPIERNVFQRGLNGYAADTMAIVRSGVNPLVPQGDALTEDASLLDQTFLDGVLFTAPDGTTSSPDDFAVLKFDGVFGAAANQSPADVPVAKAWLVLTTGDLSTSASTNGPYSVYPMLRGWDTTTLYTDFGGTPGLQQSDGDILPELDRINGAIRGSEAWFDVTSYLEAVRTGSLADNGLAVVANGTADGWQIHANGSLTEDARPRLVVLSGDLGIIGPTPGDFNDDGVVDGVDMLVWQRGFGAQFDAADLADFEANFGAGVGPQSASATTAVPEPAALMAALTALAGFVARRRRG
jgi:hypothetical protein